MMSTHDRENYQRLACEVMAYALKDLGREGFAVWLASREADIWRGWLPAVKVDAARDLARRAAVGADRLLTGVS